MFWIDTLVKVTKLVERYFLIFCWAYSWSKSFASFYLGTIENHYGLPHPNGNVQGLNRDPMLLACFPDQLRSRDMCVACQFSAAGVRRFQTLSKRNKASVMPEDVPEKDRQRMAPENVTRMDQNRMQGECQKSTEDVTRCAKEIARKNIKSLF